MSLAAKGSRAISVDGADYRWAVSPDSGYNVIVAQAVHGDGCKLLVNVHYTGINFTSANADGMISTTPALVSSIIRQARDGGWRPNENGPDFVCSIKADKTIEVR